MTARAKRKCEGLRVKVARKPMACHGSLWGSYGLHVQGGRGMGTG